MFNEGYVGDGRRRSDAARALRGGAAPRPHPGRSSSPREPEVHGLVALMEIQASRAAGARRAGGRARPSRSIRTARRWDRCSIGRGLAALERAEKLGGALGPYVLQAAIAACHARARTAAETDWARIAALYEALARLAPSPRRAAQPRRRRRHGVGTGGGPGARRYARPPSRRSRATTCCRACAATCSRSSAGSTRPAREFERAASLTHNARERELLLERAASCVRNPRG